MQQMVASKSYDKERYYEEQQGNKYSSPKGDYRQILNKQGQYDNDPKYRDRPFISGIRCIVHNIVVFVGKGSEIEV
jgi:hypothetical protein